MNGMLAVNELIQWTSESGDIVERIVWLDEGNIIVFVIDINSVKGFPIKRTVAEIAEALESGIAIKIEKDPLIRLFNDDDIKAKDKLIRDNAWEVISSMVVPENEPLIFSRSFRGPLVQKTAKEFGVMDKTVYKYLRRYWQRGKNINALLPDYDKSGGPGKPKSVGEKKRGRPRKMGLGINVDDETKRIFRVAITRYYHTEKENTLPDVYKLMIKEFYKSDVRYDNGVEKPIILSEDEIPTLNQFKYWFEQEQDIKTSLIKRKGRRKYELEHRPILGSSNTGVLGPGSVFQIDATVGDVFLVSRYNRNWIIGRPIIYVVIDVFSRLIVGVYVGLEGPSWTGAMMALANATTDKPRFCSDYGIEIDEDDWPCRYLPDVIVADRGEMMCKNADSLIKALNVRIQYAPPYRADWKGIVEQHFRIIHKRVKPFVPGYIDKDYRERGSKDYRLDATLDIYQFTQVIIKCILLHNNHHVVEGYLRDEDMVIDDIQPIPIELWKWGISNRSGRLRSFPEDIVRLNLMPTDKARVTHKGIIYKNLSYSCERALREYWFDRARRKTWQVDISYDPRNMSFIYIKEPNGKDYEKCFLLDSQARYVEKSMDEITYLFEHEKQMKAKVRHPNLQADVDHIADIQAIVKEGKKMTAEAKEDNASKASRVGSIREHRKHEKELNREQEAFELGSNNMTILKTPKRNKSSESKNPVKSERLELLKKLQRERSNDDTEH